MLRAHAVTLSLAAALAACSGGSRSSDPREETPPTGLTYADNPAVYAVGTPIAPNRPSIGGGPVQSWAVSPALPPGLSLDPATGVISGVPGAAAAEATYSVTAANAAGRATVALRITVVAFAGPPAFLAYAVNPAVYAAGTAILPNVPSSAGGAVDAYSVSPALPGGLALDPATGVISGVPAAASPATTYTVTASNAAGHATADISITVLPALTPPSGLTYALNPAVYTAGASIVPNAPSSSGSAVTSYAVSPALPAGLALDPATGVISGVPAGPAPTATYTVTARNAAGSAAVGLVLTVNAAASPPAGLAYAVNPAVYTLGTPILPNAPSVGGGAVAAYSVAPPLPAGLHLDAATGVLTGTPSALSATATYTVTATNAAGSATAGLTLTVNASVVPPSGLAYAVNPAVYTVGAPITANAPSSSGGAVTSYTVTPPLPAGLSLQASSGVLSGIPTAVSPAAAYTVTASNAAGSTSASLRITVEAAAIPPAGLAYSTNPAVYTLGAPIAPNVPSSSGGAVTSYSVAPPLPAGLGLNATTGVVSGTPAATAATAAYTITASNEAGRATAALILTVTAAVTPPSALAYAVNPALYTVGTPIAPNGPSSAGGAVTSYALSPPLPAGLTFNTATGVIAGTPAAPAAEATYTVTATNAAGTAEVELRIAVDDAVLAPADLAYAANPALYVVGTPIAPNAPTSGGSAVASYSVAPGLPDGLSLNSETGVISGTPSAEAAAAAYTVTATNAAGSASVALTIAVLPSSAPTGIALTLTSPIPADEFRIGIDGGAFGDAVQITSVKGTQLTAATTFVAVPAGGAYRVRVLALDGLRVGAYLRRASASGAGVVSVVDGARASLAVALEVPSITVTAPEAAVQGEPFRVEWTVHDSGQSLDRSFGLFGRMSWATAPFEDKLSAIPQAPGVPDRLDPSTARFTATLAAPDAPGTLYFQVTAGTFDSGVYHLTPFTAAGEPLRTIAIAEPPTGIRLALEAPVPLGELRIGIDGGALGSSVRLLTLDGRGQPELSVVLALPAGGPYRVRAIATDPGAIDTYLRSVAAAGGTDGVVVAEGARTPVRVPLAPAAVAISAPTSVARGETFQVVWTYGDPGATLEYETGLFGRTSWDLTPFLDKLSVQPLAPGLGERLAGGTVRFATTIRAPDQPGTLFFQTIAGTFDSGVYLVAPCTARGEALRAIEVR